MPTLLYSVFFVRLSYCAMLPIQRELPRCYIQRCIKSELLYMLHIMVISLSLSCSSHDIPYFYPFYMKFDFFLCWQVRDDIEKVIAQDGSRGPTLVRWCNVRCHTVLFSNTSMYFPSVNGKVGDIWQMIPPDLTLLRDCCWNRWKPEAWLAHALFRNAFRFYTRITGRSRVG